MAILIFFSHLWCFEYFPIDMEASIGSHFSTMFVQSHQLIFWQLHAILLLLQFLHSVDSWVPYLGIENIVLTNIFCHPPDWQMGKRRIQRYCISVFEFSKLVIFILRNLQPITSFLKAHYYAVQLTTDFSIHGILFFGKAVWPKNTENQYTIDALA